MPLPDNRADWDLAVVARDDRLIEALSRGADPPPGDPLAELLAFGRDQVTAQTSAEDHDGPTIDLKSTRSARRHLTLATAPPLTPTGDGPRHRFPLTRPRIARMAAVFVAVSCVLASVGVASLQAEPGSPLWMVTKTLYPDIADTRLVERHIEKAREAVATGNPHEAQHHVDLALHDVTLINNPKTATRLRLDIETVARRIPSHLDLPNTTMPTIATVPPLIESLTASPPAPTVTRSAPAAPPPAPPSPPRPSTAPPPATPSPSPSQSLLPDIDVQLPAPLDMPAEEPSGNTSGSDGEIVGDVVDGVTDGLNKILP